MAALCPDCLQPLRPVNECICDDDEDESSTEEEGASES